MITLRIFDEATWVKTIYKQSSGTGIPSHVPAQTGHYIFSETPWRHNMARC